MYDVITIGTASLDIIVKSDHFTLTPLESGVALCQAYGEKIDVEKLALSSGGGATNVAVGLRRLGFQVGVIAEVGQDEASRVIISEMIKEGLETSLMVSEKTEHTAISILLVAQEGGRTILTHRGASSQLESRDINWSKLQEVRWVHLGSASGDMQLVVDLFELFSRKQMGVSWTPTSKDLQLFLDHPDLTRQIHADVLILNDTEWESIRSLHELMLERMDLVVVTAGRLGGTVYNQQRKLFDYQAIVTTTVEETGAGDAFATGLIAGVLSGQTLPTCVEWGKRNAASVVQFLGAKQGLLTKNQIINSQIPAQP